MGDKWEAWSAMRPQDDHATTNSEGKHSGEVMDALGVEHKCCRIVMLTTNDLLPTLNGFARPKIHNRE